MPGRPEGGYDPMRIIAAVRSALIDASNHLNELEAPDSLRASGLFLAANTAIDDAMRAVDALVEDNESW